MIIAEEEVRWVQYEISWQRRHRGWKSV